MHGSLQLQKCKFKHIPLFYQNFIIALLYILIVTSKLWINLLGVVIIISSVKSRWLPNQATNASYTRINIYSVEIQSSRIVNAIISHTSILYFSLFRQDYFVSLKYLDSKTK